MNIVPRTVSAVQDYVLIGAVLAVGYVVYKAYSASSSALDSAVNTFSHPFDSTTHWLQRAFGLDHADLPPDIDTTNPDGTVTTTTYQPSDAAPPDWLGGGPMRPSGTTYTSYPDTGGVMLPNGTLPNGETPAE